MSDTKIYRVRWPKSQHLVASFDDILDARDSQRLNPGTSIYRFANADRREVLLAFPVPDAPKEPSR